MALRRVNRRGLGRLTDALPGTRFVRGIRVLRHIELSEQEAAMHLHRHLPSSPLTPESRTMWLANEWQQSDGSTGVSEQQAETIWQNLEGLLVQRNDAHRIVIIAGRWIRLSPTQYALLVPLLEHYGHPVSHAEIYQRAFGSSYSPRDARRTYYHIDKLRPRLSSFGLLIRSVIDHGYMLLREPREP